RVLRLFLEPGITGADLLLARVLGNAQLVEGVVSGRIRVRLVYGQRRLGLLDANLLAAGEDFMASVLLIPFGEGGRHVHLLDDIPPAHARVVGAEADFTFLRSIRNDALLGTAEVVVEQILEPHAGNEQEV